jgi:hypothetical protein
MKKIKVVISEEYVLNKSRVFAMIDGKYVGCMIYPTSRNFPEMEYWKTALSSDAGRGFFVVEKEFLEKEIENIFALQNAIDALKNIIPPQPSFERPAKDWTVKRGVKYENWKTENEAVDKQISAYFESIKIYDSALKKAEKELRYILISK